MGIKMVPSINIFLGKEVVAVTEIGELHARLIGADTHYAFFAVCMDEQTVEYMAIPHGRIRAIKIKP